MAPTIWPSTMMGSAPGLREVAHERRRQVLAAADPLVGLRGGAAPAQGRLRLQQSGIDGVGGAPCMAWDSTTLPPQSRIAMATTCLFCSAQAEQASTRARAPALEMILIVVVACVGEMAGACWACNDASGNRANPATTRDRNAVFFTWNPPWHRYACLAAFSGQPLR